MKTTIDFTALLDDLKTQYSTTSRGQECPEIEMLLDYVYEDMDKELKQSITPHLSSCAGCSVMMLRIAADKKKWELEMELSPDQALAHALGKDGRKRAAAIISRQQGDSFFSEARETIKTWMSQVWNPMWTGQLVTAADTPRQTHVFDLEDGEYVKLACSWQGDKTGRSPKVMLSWSANIFLPSVIYVHFIDPATGGEFFTERLGAELEGSVVLEKPTINFDPTAQEWGIKISVEPKI